jgi:hypothetical protein
MANTVSVLSYANTFGDWVVNSNLLTNEINAIGFGNWHKPTGTLYLDNSTLALYVGTGGIQAYGNTQFLGTANSTSINSNLSVGGQLYLTNTSTTLYSSGPIFTPSIVINGNTYNGIVTSNQLASSIALTGIPTAPTAGLATSTTQIATTAFVTTAISNATGSLGTMSTQNSSAVNITGGTITGVNIANTQISGLITSSQIASVANTQITGNINAVQVVTANFRVVQSGNKLFFYYNNTPIVSIDSTGNIVSANTVTAVGTP